MRFRRWSDGARLLHQGQNLPHRVREPRDGPTEREVLLLQLLPVQPRGAAHPRPPPPLGQPAAAPAPSERARAQDTRTGRRCAPSPSLWEECNQLSRGTVVLAMACIKIRLLWERNRPKTRTKRRDLGDYLFVSENCFFMTFTGKLPRFWAIGLKTFNFDGDFRTIVSQLRCSVENLHSLLKVMPPKMEKFYIFGHIKQSLFCIWRPYCFADGLSSLLNLINVKCKS